MIDDWEMASERPHTGDPGARARRLQSKQRDDGRKVAIAQSDDGDIQMGDRVNIVTDRNGVARAVRDTSGYRRDS